EIARQLGREDGRRVAGEPDCWLETFLAIHDAGRMLLSSTLLAEDALQALGAAAAYVDLVRAGASAGRPLVPRGESVDALAVRLAAAGFTRGAESLRETRALAGVVAARSRAGVRGGDLDGDVVLVGTTVHAELLAWAIVALGASLLALPVALRARRRALPAPSSPGVHVAAALTPFALLLYLGIRGVLPGAPPEAGRGWIDALAQPGLFVHLLPLSALAVLALPHLFVRRLRSAWSFGRGAARFFAGYAVLLLLAFAASAPLISREREARARTLATLLVDLQGGPAWPALGTGS
ncbi:MAG: hypothetical protein HY812_22015, partial [Planctomycetes bacterium]|nr:hypothetical protein [Planctomycetota bacterium]